MGNRRRTVNRRHRGRDVVIELRPAPLSQASTHHLQAAGDTGQKVVEVMRQPAGHLANSLHLLRLAQRFLDPPTLHCLGLQLGVRLVEFAGFSAVDLQDAERGFILAADYDDVDNRPDAVFDRERRIPEPRFH
jgi:hypothetical protein